MSQKRNPGDFSGKKDLEGNQSVGDKRRRTRSFRSVVQEVLQQLRLQRIQQALEPVLRKVVKEEIESAIRKHAIYFNRHSEEDVFPPESRSLRLKFMSALSLPVFTGARIGGEDGSAIKVGLVDNFAGEVVQYAPESSAKVEVVVLEGDFDTNDTGNWTPAEFTNNIVRQRTGKKPLLTGDVFFCLKNGIGYVGEVSFTDNSSWTRSRKFRLGARVAGTSDEANIKEAKTEPFIVRDHRGELYKKHHPPCLSDEVWRLEKIGKDGAFHNRLSKAKVNTVKDFLTLLHLNPEQLRSTLGPGMSAKMWEVTAEHARTCVLGEKVFLTPTSQHNNSVVFNVVGQVMGLYSGNQYTPIDRMSDNEKHNAQEMVKEAIQHWEGVTSYEDLNALLDITPQQTASSSGTMTPDDDKKALTSKKMVSPDYAKPNLPMHMPMPSTPHLLGGMSCTSEDFSLHALNAFSPGLDQPLDSLLIEPDYLMSSFDHHKNLGFSDIDYSSFQSETPGLSRAVRRPADRRWRVLSSVVWWLMRWRRTGDRSR